MLLKKDNLYEFDEFRINLSERTLWHHHELIPLPPKVMETLCLLVENHGRLLTKEELMEQLWSNTFVEEKNLTQNIFTLRKILGEGKDGKKFIETLPRRGYRFVAEVHLLEQQEAIQVTHHKQTRITAEGFVSTQELTEAVKEITRSLVLEKENEIDWPRQIPAAPRKPFYRSVWFLTFGVVSFLILGTIFWMGARKLPGAGAVARPVLSYERLTESGNAFFPAISPDKQYIAYVLNEKSKFRMLLQHLPTGSTTEIVSPRDYALRSPQFSPDGNFLFYSARDGKQESTIYKTPIFGGPAQQIVTNANQNFSISPDGERLAFFRHDPKINGNHLIVCRSQDGSEERIVATHRDRTAFRVWGAFPAWSPDAKKIVASVIDVLPDRSGENKSYFVEIDLTNGSEKKLNSPDWKIAFQAYWLADGSGLIAQVQEKSDSFFQFHYLAYPSGEARPLSNDTNNYTEFRLAPDASFIIATEEKAPHNLQLISAENPTQIRQLTDSAAVQRGYLGLEWTPDGRELIYLQLDGLTAGNIWKMNTETFEARQLTFDEGIMNRYPNVTPDGGSIVFSSNRTGKWHIWQMNIDGSNLRQITDGTGENYPRVSPDGKWLLYATPAVRPNTLWKRPLAGGEAVKLLDHAGGVSSISPDMKHIVANYYDPDEKVKDPWKYVLIPFEIGGSPKDTGFQPQHQTVRWKPDGSGIYFLSRGQSHTNIWFYSLADGSKRPVTEYDSQEIAGLAVSPDGKTFAVARSKRASNIFKIGGF